MRFLILSDIHANWYALESVLEDAQGLYERVVCCGDLVGYNPHPDQVIHWVKENCAHVIRGNHDKAVAGLESLEWFNEVAQAAARWTMDHLEPADKQYLVDLPKGPATVEGFQICHGSLGDEDEYVISARDALPHFALLECPLAFFGHTHVQGGFFLKRNRAGVLPRLDLQDSERVIELGTDYLYLVNPGSVGQPRDGDSRAAYAIFDSEQKTVTLRRVKYPIKKTAFDIGVAGLPSVLGFRLFHGA